MTTRNYTGAQSAGSEAINNYNGDLTRFYDSSTAGAASIFSNAGGTTQFFGASKAALASLTANYGGVIDFHDASVADRASITSNYNGLVRFFDNSNPGSARLATNSGGVVDFSYTSGVTGASAISAGSIAGTGAYLLGANQLTVGGDNLSTTVSGTIQDGGGYGGVGGSLVKVGTGTLTLSGQNAFSGGIKIVSGSLSLASDEAAGSGAISFADGVQILRIGSGVLGDPGGTFGNALSGFGLGDTLNLRGLAFAGGATASLNGDVLTVTSGGVSESFAFTGSAGQVFEVANDGAGGSAVRLLSTFGTRSGTTGNDTLIYTSPANYDTMDGLAGTDRLVIKATNFSISAGGGALKLDVASDGSVDLTARSMERLDLSGQNIDLRGDLTAGGLSATDGIVVRAVDGGTRFDAHLLTSGQTISAYGGAGSDIFTGGKGADRFYEIEIGDRVVAGGGNDTIDLWAGGGVDGGSGTDIVRLHSSGSMSPFTGVEKIYVDNNLSVNFSFGSGGGVFYSMSILGGFVNIIGGDYGSDTFYGGAGSDNFSSNYENLRGDKFFSIGAGDRISGGLGDEYAEIWGSPTSIRLDDGYDTVVVRANTVFLAGSVFSVESIRVSNNVSADLSALEYGMNLSSQSLERIRFIPARIRRP